MNTDPVHAESKTFGDEVFSLLVFVDGRASFAIFEGNAVQSMREVEPHEDGSDIAICGEAKEWFDRELATGREKAGAS